MVKDCIIPDEGNDKLLAKLKINNIDVQACYQCGRCSSGCPIANYFDLSVMEVVRLSFYGQEDRLLQSHTIWLCAACETCSTRCPNGIEIAGLMDVLREIALRKGVTPAEPHIAVFHRSFLRSVARWGRTYEVGMLGNYKIRTGDLTGDMWLGLRMFLKGKLKLFPHTIKNRAEIRAIFSGKGKEYDR